MGYTNLNKQKNNQQKMSLLFVPNTNTCDCYRCTPQQPSHLGFFETPVFHSRPQTARRPARKMVRKPFANFFDDDFMTFENRSNSFFNRSFNPFNGFAGFDNTFDDMENEFIGDNFFNPKRLQQKNRSQNLNRQKAGKENMDPCFDNNANTANKKDIFVTPAKNTNITEESTNDTLKNKPFFESRQFNSNTIVNNGNRTTINKNTVTKNDKTKTVVEKITQNQEGDKFVTNITPEKYDTEVKALFDNEGNEDMIFKAIPSENMNMIAQEPLDEDKMFEEKIKESSNSFEKVHNEDSKSSSHSGNMMFSDIQF